MAALVRIARTGTQGNEMLPLLDQAVWLEGQLAKQPSFADVLQVTAKRFPRKTYTQVVTF